MSKQGDIEKDLKFRLKELAGDAMAASADEVQLILDRLDGYRKSMQNKRHKWDLSMVPLRKELSEQRWLVAWARKQLDPIKKGGPSCLDVYEMAELLKEIDKRCGHREAQRILYGQPINPELANERIGVLEAAIVEAKAAEQRWRDYLLRERAKCK